MKHKKHQDPEVEEPGDEKIIDTDEPTPITEELTEESVWQAKAEEYLNDLKRCQADFENYKKRQQESQKELGGYLIEKLVLDIIPVLDNFRAATMHVPEAEKSSPWVIGIQYIEKQLETVLTDNGMQTIEAAEGEAFDPKIHEAVGTDDARGKTQEVREDDSEMSEQTTNDEQRTTEENSEESDRSSVIGHQSVAKMVQKGYRLGDKVIRAARVIVR